MQYEHEPVLLAEVLCGLAIKADGIYIDATFGRGGHSRKILEQLGPQGRLIALDRDPQALAAGKQAAFCDSRFTLVQATFGNIKKIASEQGCLGKVNGILIDLGVSSPQLDDPTRGFSFYRDGPLDMRMDPQQHMDAASWLNVASESEIADVLYRYGEERYARRIARAVVEQRQNQRIERTKQLADLISKVSPTRERHKHPATRSFQAIRIFINNELEELRNCLAQCLEVLTSGGRICAISFHSLEDRIIKQFISKEARGDDYPPDLPLKAKELKPRLRKINGLIRPSSAEVQRNPRSHSARLRIMEKII